MRRRLELLDLPRSCERSLYERSIEKVVAELSRHKFVRSAYVVGGFGHPGISDIDLLVAVDDASASALDPLEGLDEAERYLFTHSCFLVPETLAARLPIYSVYQEYRCVYGREVALDRGDSPVDRANVDQQVALEFLAKNLLDLYIQLEYRMVKVRALLQHAKGLRLDLQLLGIDRGPLCTVVDEMCDLVDRWFELSPQAVDLDRLLPELLRSLHQTVDEALRASPLYTPGPLPLKVAPNMTIRTGAAVALRHRGVRMPVWGVRGRQRFNVQHRSNRFELHLNLGPAAPRSLHVERFEFLGQLKAFATARFPSFSAPVPPLYYNAL